MKESTIFNTTICLIGSKLFLLATNFPPIFFMYQSLEKILHIHNLLFFFGLLGYVHINNSLFEAFITTDDLGGDWRGSIAVVADNNITKKIWFGWISGRIQTGMFFFIFCCFPISLSFGGRLIIIVTRGSSFSVLLRLFLRFLEKMNKKNKETEMEYLPGG